MTTLKEIFNTACRVFGVSAFDLRHSKDKELINIRKAFSYCAHQHCPNKSNRAIAMMLSKDASPVEFYLRYLKKTNDAEVMILVQKLNNEITNKNK